jgi:hypothetical protein
VYAAEHDLRTTCVRTLPDLVAAQCVAGVDADADNVARLHGVYVERFQCFVTDLWPTIHRRRRTRQHEEPTRRDDANAERQVARINQMNNHAVVVFSSRLIAPHIVIAAGTPGQSGTPGCSRAITHV